MLTFTLIQENDDFTRTISVAEEDADHALLYLTIPREMELGTGDVDEVNVVFRGVKPWDGKGTPPAGTTCEMRVSDADPWREVKILFQSKMNTVLEFTSNGNESIYHTSYLKFRLVPSPVELKREAGGRAIFELLTLGCRQDPWESISDECKDLYREAFDAAQEATK